MTVVVDTNVVAYYLLGTQPFADECRSFWRRAVRVYAPASWEIELVNVLWLCTRAQGLDAAQAVDRLRQAAQLGIFSVPVKDLWEGTLAKAAAANHPAHDTVFVELASRLGVPLATFDKQVLAKFPQIAVRPRALPTWQPVS